MLHFLYYHQGKASIKTQPFAVLSLKVGVAIGYLCSLGNIDPFSFIYESSVVGLAASEPQGSY